MAGIAKKKLLGVGMPWVAFWAVVLGASAFFAFESIEYLAYQEASPGESLIERRFWIYVHGAMAIPILFIAPLQFHPGIRSGFPRFHRWTGRAFVSASILAALLAIFLAIEYEYTGSRPALVIFGLLWLFFSVSAWLCAARRDFVSHRAFMIRSVTIGFAFVWVRVLRVTQDYLLPFIESYEMRTVVREYVCFIIPLLIVEFWLVWWPTLKRSASR